MDLRFYGKLLLRRLPYLLLLFALGSAIGVTLATVLPPVYVARATLIVESQQIPSDLAATTVEVAALEQLQIIEQRILTRASLIDMANRLRVYAPRPGEAAVPMAADAIVSDMRRRIRIATTGGGGGNRAPSQATIVTVSFEAPSAQLSAAVTNEIVTMILAENVAIRTTVASDTLRFFQSEVARLEQELTRVGAEILAFQEANLDALPDSLDFRRSQQAAAQERLLDVQRTETALRDRRETLIRLYETTGAVPDPAPQSETPEARQLRALRDELSAALAILSPQNPRVRLLEQQVAQLEATVAAQAAAGAAPGPSTSGLSPLDVQLADIDAQMRFLAEQRAQIEATLAALTASIERTPANAIRLDTLQRDYANLRAQYDQAVASRALAETGEMIETLAKGQRISVIEQATPPAAPDSPNRPLIAAAGIGGGLAAGLGLILLMEVLNSAVRRPADLTARLGITPLATLPLMRTAAEAWRRRAIIALAFSIALVAIPAGLWVVHTRVTPLDLLFDRVFEQLGVAPPDFLSPA